MEASKCSYAGFLTSGEPIVSISGFVNEADCQWVFDKLDSLIADGQTTIVFDYSGVQNVAFAWFESQIRIRERGSNGTIKIKVRHSADGPDAKQTAERNQLPGKCGVPFLRLFNHVFPTEKLDTAQD